MEDWTPASDRNPSVSFLLWHVLQVGVTVSPTAKSNIAPEKSEKKDQVQKGRQEKVSGGAIAFDRFECLEKPNPAPSHPLIISFLPCPCCTYCPSLHRGRETRPFPKRNSLPLHFPRSWLDPWLLCLWSACC